MASALLVLSVALPLPRPAAPRGIWDRTTRGIRIYLAMPRLRGLLALSLSVAAAGSMVIVNTVVLVQGALGLGETEVALALAAFGGGSMLSALALPRILDRVPDRPVMLAGAALLTIGTAAGPLVSALPGLLALWAALGLGYGLVMTPSGRLLRRSAAPEDRPALFAAQFALSHACWLLAYPLAGRIGAGPGLDAAFLVLAAHSASGLVLALRLWPAGEADAPAHEHPDLSPDHPHLRDHGTRPHSHPVVIDALHPRWPGVAG